MQILMVRKRDIKLLTTKNKHIIHELKRICKRENGGTFTCRLVSFSELKSWGQKTQHREYSQCCNNFGDSNYIYCSEHFIMYKILESMLYTCN